MNCEYDEPPVEVRQEFPPNIDRIREKFPLQGGEIFAWDGVVYTGDDGPTALPPELIAHEKVHFRQQAGKPAEWWDRYIDDDEFRFEQEREAHVAEIKEFNRHNKDRNKRAYFKRRVAMRLAGPLYGNDLSISEAMSLLSDLSSRRP